MTYKIERDTILVLENEIIDKEILLQYDNIWFCNEFDKSLDFLTTNIKSITFENHSIFSQPLDNLHNGLEYLRLSQYYRLPLDFLPNSLKTLIFPVSDYYEYGFNNLPIGLKELSLGNFYCSLDNLPPNLEIFSVPYWYNGSWNVFPKSIKTIKIPNTAPPRFWNENFKKFIEERKVEVNFQH